MAVFIAPGLQGSNGGSPWAPIRARHRGRSLARLFAAALLTAGVGLIHLAVAPVHLAESTPFGILFIATGLAQLVLAVAIVTVPSTRLFAIATWGTLGVIAVWVTSRTTGLPVGPVVWTPEHLGATDMLATLFEMIAVILYLSLIRTPRQPHLRGPVRVTLATTPAVVVGALCVMLAAGSVLNPMPAAFNVAPAVPGHSTVSVQALVAPTGAEPVRDFTLTAAELKLGGRTTYAYNGSVPGPELRVRQGDRVRILLVNHLPESTSIHWHGINVPNAEDGVAGVTQQAVASGRSFQYEFIAGEPGSYWYHAHQATEQQLRRGLYGPIVVLPRAGIAETRDHSLLLHTAVDSDDIRVNGVQDLHLDAAPGETVRLRLINAVVPVGSGADPLVPVLLGAPYRIVALDGHDLNAPAELGPARIRLGMGQRADLVFTMPAAQRVMLTGLTVAKTYPWSAQPKPATVTIGAGLAPEPVATPPLFDLTSYGEPAADPVAAATSFDVERTLQLAASPGFRNGTFDFEETFSGSASPLVQPIRVKEGQLVKLHLVNRSQKFHPIHIHGHTFTVLARNGRRITGSPVHLDALLVPPGETWDVAFKADNPGIWMLHCHVLAHAAGGMSMTVNYEGVSTPFSMGILSGNEPE